MRIIAYPVAEHQSMSCILVSKTRGVTKSSESYQGSSWA
jgi:hypothetical protein